MKEKSVFGAGRTVGAASLMTIFAVLSLTVFALLSDNTALADARLSRVSADAAAAYYAAEAESERILAELRAGKMPAKVVCEDGVYRYDTAISDTGRLETEVRLDGNGGYEILRRQSVSLTEWQADEKMDVWDGVTE
ncbi:MAG: hypothetical protein IKM31_10450 [Oscillospiraceae bacterium]|nr:hypothetical protein [Oscillospiraceae bacterium]